jgi:uncharacterized protein YndB with AHSA1/START domain
MSVTGPGASAQSTTADREIVVTRLVGAPPERVFEAFTEVRHLSRWWGPEGFTTSTRAFEFGVGGVWDFVMHGPDGTDYQEWITWTEIVPPERIALLHGESRDDPDAFESVLTLQAEGADQPGDDDLPIGRRGLRRRAWSGHAHRCSSCRSCSRSCT